MSRTKGTPDPPGATHNVLSAKYSMFSSEPAAVRASSSVSIGVEWLCETGDRWRRGELHLQGKVLLISCILSNWHCWPSGVCMGIIMTIVRQTDYYHQEFLAFSIKSTISTMSIVSYLIPCPWCPPHHVKPHVQIAERDKLGLHNPNGASRAMIFCELMSVWES